MTDAENVDREARAAQPSPRDHSSHSAASTAVQKEEWPSQQQRRQSAGVADPEKDGATPGPGHDGAVGDHPTADETDTRLNPRDSFDTTAAPSLSQENEKLAAVPDVPDGGRRAWLNCAGSFFSFFASFGIVNSYGVFQDYYKGGRLSQENDSVIALIGAIQLFCLYGFGPLIGKFFDSFGVFNLLSSGGFCIVFSLMMLSLAQPGAVYQYFLAQAVLFGIGCALVFTPGLALMGHYFRTKRPLAIGLVASGSSLGGVVFPILLQRLIPRVGFGWAVRTAAFVALACFIFSATVCRTRLPLRKTTRREILRAVDFGGFRDPRYCLATLSAFITFYAIFIPYFYIKQYAQLRGMSADLASYLLPLINALGIFSRTIPAIFSPRVGVLNLMIFFTSTAGILVLALWLPSSGNASIIVFAALYGFFSGPFISLLPAYVAIISPQPVYGARLGALYLVVAVATLVGTPTGGALVGSGSLQHYHSLIGFTGALVVAGAAILFPIWLIDVRTLIASHRKNKPGVPMRWSDFKV